MLIARASVQQSIWKYKGQQYHYTGHVCSFMQNTAKITNKLPRLPAKVDILKLVPTSDPNSSVRREFEKMCIVRRLCVETWLKHLIAHNPGYQDMVLDEYRLSQLPDDASIYDQLCS